MSDNKISVDDFFKQQQEQLPPATSPDADWAQMTQLLDRVPKRRLRKKTTRRIIQWMGGLALVTTVTYYAVKQKRVTPKAPATVATTRGKLPIAPARMATDTGSSKSSMPSAKSITAAKAIIQKNKPTTPILSRRQNPYQRLVRQVSDTVMLETVKAPQPTATRPITAVVPVTEASPTGRAVVSNWLQQLAAPPTVFEIDPLRDTVLICPQGTVLRVPRFAFGGEKGKGAVKKTIQLTVKECYRYTDMLANQLSTTTPTDVLATGGMVHISAMSDSDQIRPVLFRPISISMPMQQYDPAMQLYLPLPTTDSSSSFNWRPDGQVQAYQNHIPFKGRTHIKVMDIQQRIDKDGKDNVAYFNVSPVTAIDVQQAKTLLRQRYPYGSQKINITMQEQVLPTTTIKGSQAKATDKGFIMLDSISLPFYKALSSKLISTQDSLAFVTQRRQDSIVWRAKVVQDSMAFVKRMRFEKSYSFNVNKLGWINCDRLLAPPQTPRVEFVINCAGGEVPSQGIYSLVLNSQKAILMGQYRQGQIHFGNVPDGLSGQLICVSEIDNKVKSCVRPIQIRAGMSLPLQFTETDPEKFKQQLAAMDAALVN